MKPAIIEIVGGAYWEECSFPPRSVYRGSGMRAAAILASFDVNVRLHSALGPSLKPHFVEIANNLNIQLDARDKSTDVKFQYSHPLASPHISRIPSSCSFNGEAVIADTALVFGMIEGRIPVRAKRVVYDSQDGFRSKPFEHNGSTAEELALVVSYSEGVALTDKQDPDDIASNLLERPNVSAVVIKCGPQGALVATRDNRNWISSFPTKRVYKVGSGDVFSAAFAFAWLYQNKPPLLSAWFASRVVASYVETSCDSLDESTINACWEDAEDALNTRTRNSAKLVPETQIYLAGPFFSTAQRWGVDEARSALIDMGFKVFSPVHDVGMGSSDEVVRQDLYELDRSGVVLALLNDLDPGTIFEVGYAKAKGIPVIAIAESAKESDLTMLLGSGCFVVDDFSTGIYYACWQLMGDV
ncbi:MAG: PfkB family carbohydrate kinase [Gallionella sp.]|nr:PfkB family carbohydrate kinase [Gallionella sp.]